MVLPEEEVGGEADHPEVGETETDLEWGINRVAIPETTRRPAHEMGLRLTEMGTLAMGLKRLPHLMGMAEAVTLLHHRYLPMEVMEAAIHTLLTHRHHLQMDMEVTGQPPCRAMVATHPRDLVMVGIHTTLLPHLRYPLMEAIKDRHPARAIMEILMGHYHLDLQVVIPHLLGGIRSCSSIM